MTAMVIADSHVAVRSKEFHQRNITLFMLAHSVGKLHDSLWGGFRNVINQGELNVSLGGRDGGRFHIAKIANIIYRIHPWCSRSSIPW